VDRAAADFPVTARLERTDAAHAGQVETVRARYVVGCDGARSAVRRSIGRQLVGDSANQAWGVMDLLAVTDFPDIRYKVAVQSPHGNLLVIPREGGYLVRLYVEMDKLGDEERVATRQITVERLIGAARRILQPYTLQVEEVPWWSVYEIGQRICDKYDDVSAKEVPSRLPCVFIAGDACHTHSPKAGQGMNFSMQDSFNLGWKLAAVLRKQCAPELLHTYSAERQVVAQELIDFDREWAKMFSDRPSQGGDAAGVDPKEFQRYFVRHARFTAGMGTQYRPSVICGDATHQQLATGFVIGTVVGLGLAVLMARYKVVERGLLPYLVISQTVPLIALAPLVVSWGGKLHIGGFEWPRWLSAAVLGAFLNVRTNAKDLEDRAAAEDYVARGKAIAERATRLELEILAIVES